MKSFPMFIKTTGRQVVIAGGGERAAQKARLILKTDAAIILAVPKLDDELAALVAGGRASHAPGAVTAAMFEGAAMAFMIAGAVSSIPAMAAVWSLVKGPIFLAYLGLGILGAILIGTIFEFMIS